MYHTYIHVHVHGYASDLKEAPLPLKKRATLEYMYVVTLLAIYTYPPFFYVLHVIQVHGHVYERKKLYI